MAGITMARNVEALTAERDKLSVDLADKALTIRKLLEDNQYLQNKLDNAKFQTSTLLDYAKSAAIKRQISRESIETLGYRPPPERDSSGSPVRQFI